MNYILEGLRVLDVKYWIFSISRDKKKKLDSGGQLYGLGSVEVTIS
jgi:hypothetical protein